MRELGLLSTGEGLRQTYPEIQALTAECRFHDCAHDTEPGCAVRAALTDGALSTERVVSWQRLTREQQRAERKTDKLARSQERKARRRFARAIRRRQRDKDRY